MGLMKMLLRWMIVCVVFQLMVIVLLPLHLLRRAAVWLIFWWLMVVWFLWRAIRR